MKRNDGAQIERPNYSGKVLGCGNVLERTQAKYLRSCVSWDAQYVKGETKKCELAYVDPYMGKKKLKGKAR